GSIVLLNTASINLSIMGRSSRRPRPAPICAEASDGILHHDHVLRRYALAGCAAQILMRHFKGSAKSFGGMPGPARVVQHTPANTDEISFLICDDGLGMMRVANQAHTHGGDVYCLLNAGCKWHLITRP